MGNRGTARCVAASLLTMATALALPAGAVGAEESAQAASLQARAVADGLRIGFGMPKFLIVEQFIDGGGPVAEAVTDPLTNRGFASLPYPGDNGIGGPGTVAGLIGAPSPPSYPFYVASSYPSQEKASWGQEGWKLEARSNDTSSRAVAQGGSMGAQAAVLGSSAEAETSRDAVTGGVLARASATVDGFRIGEVFSIGRASSSARSSRSAAGEATRESSFRMDGMSIGGQAVSFSPAGFALAGQKTPLPDSSPLLQALAAQGVSLTYLAPVETADGVTSAGLRITHTVKLASGQTIRTTFTLGRSSAQTASLSTE